MYYFIGWVAFMLICMLALPIAAMMEKKRQAASMAAAGGAGQGDDGFGQEDEYPQEYGEAEAPQEDAFAEAGGDFPAEELPEAGEPVVDDFSAFDEEFK
jgi:hypothetical protein